MVGKIEPFIGHQWNRIRAETFNIIWKHMGRSLLIVKPINEELSKTYLNEKKKKDTFLDAMHFDLYYFFKRFTKICLRRISITRWTLS